MTVFAALDFRIELNSVVMSAWVTKATLDVEVEDLETTAFGTGGSKSRIGGLKDGTLSLELNQDFAASAVDATLWPLVGTVFTAKIRPASGAISATNPEYSGSVLLTKYSPFDGSVGDLAGTKIEMPTSGVWARAVS